MEIIEIIVCVALIILLAPYLEFLTNLITSFLPTPLLLFCLLAISISVIQYIFARKDD